MSHERKLRNYQWRGGMNAPIFRDASVKNGELTLMIGDYSLVSDSCDFVISAP
jgi:hypothetical protein